ncbi:MAG: MerR family transcriptional regulator [Pseudomonadota bacterium]
MKDSSGQNSAATLKIGAVSRITGLSPHTIRKWEERHQAVRPLRGSGGERLYTQDEVRRIAYLKRLTEAGFAISQIASLSLPELLETSTEHANSPNPESSPNPTRDVPIGVVLMGPTLGALAEPGLRTSDAIRLSGTSVSIEDWQNSSAPAPAVLVIEVPVVGPNAISDITSIQAKVGAAHVVVVYGFADSTRLGRLRASGFGICRAPVGADELIIAILATAGREPTPPPATRPIPSQRKAPTLSRELLAKIAAQEPTLPCECPRHLVGIILSLKAFEEYNLQCATDNPQDAALHQHLLQTCETSRAAFEEALVQLAEAEGFDLN